MSLNEWIFAVCATTVYFGIFLFVVVNGFDEGIHKTKGMWFVLGSSLVWPGLVVVLYAIAYWPEISGGATACVKWLRHPWESLHAFADRRHERNG